MTWKPDSILIAGLLGALCMPLQGQETLAIDNVTLIDGTGRSAMPNACVVVSAGHIAKAGSCPVPAPAGARHINGQGKFLIPGLMDVHVHLRGGGGFDSSAPNERTGIRHLHSYIYAGVTTILDVGNNPNFIFKLRDMERSGKIVSPRLLAAGGIVTYPGSHGSGPNATLVDSWPGSMPKVDEAIARQPDMMKLTYDEHGWGTRPMITLLPVDLMTKVIRYYNDHGIRTTAHISSETRALEAIFAGIDTLAHPVIQGPVSDNYVRLMRAKLIPEASTLTVGESYSRLAEHPEFLDQPLYRDTVEPEEIRQLKTVESNKQKENRWAWWMKVMTPVAQENLKKITAAGGIISLGTDQSLGAAVHRELELLVGGGIPALEAIRIGTLNAAIFLGRERDMGSVEQGKLADLVLLDANPLDDINNAKKINMVIKEGKIVDRSKLDLPVNRRTADSQ
ncbi:MAG TPA: amidohydrolase family protein [Candidatus Acidoferrales bacterium]|nr:amidohydrolase family protein [Candidatus Acidoferrales bacterium]